MTGYVHILGLVTQLVNHKKFAQGSTTGLPIVMVLPAVFVYIIVVYFIDKVYGERISLQ